MRKIFFILLGMLSLALNMWAGNIPNMSRWWDGTTLFTARVAQDGAVTLKGQTVDIGAPDDVLLTKVKGETGNYRLAVSSPEAGLSVRGKIGYRVDYVSNSEGQFIIVRNPNGDAVHVLIAVMGDLNKWVKQEETMEEEPVGDVISTRVINPHWLGRFSKQELRLLRNEILARNGWQFQSADLQRYFSKKTWYYSIGDNDKVALTFIEKLNIQLIKSEEALPEEQRQVGTTVTVYDAEQFIRALRSNRHIRLGRDVHINLSWILEDQDFFMNTEGMELSMDASTVRTNGSVAISEGVFDGRQLVLKNFQNLTISGIGNSSIEVNPRYSFCLQFVNCVNINIENLTIGHTEGGNCEGGVIGTKGCRDVSIRRCDLYGCGTYGLVLDNTDRFMLSASCIHHCTYGIMEMRACNDVEFFNCDFYDNKEYTLIYAAGVKKLQFIGCQFFNNHPSAPLFMVDNRFTAENCYIAHPSEYLGSYVDYVMTKSDRPNRFIDTATSSDVTRKGIGPEQ